MDEGFNRLQEMRQLKKLREAETERMAAIARGEVVEAPAGAPAAEAPSTGEAEQQQSQPNGIKGIQCQPADDVLRRNGRRGR